MYVFSFVEKFIYKSGKQVTCAFFFLFFFLLRDLSTRGENKLQVPSNHNPSKAVSNEDQKEIFISVMLAFISLHLSNKEES